MKVRNSRAALAADKIRQLPQLSVDPTEYADMLFGVGSATSAGPTLPAGSIHPCPETLEKDLIFLKIYTKHILEAKITDIMPLKVNLC